MTEPSKTKLFPLPFTKEYWQTAVREGKQLRMLAVAALLVALRIVISSFFIPIGENQRIYFSFFVNALGSLIYGPVVSLGTGFVSDILGYIIHPTGEFFPGYTLTTMMGAFTYAVFFYRARITVLRITLCKICVNLLVNVGLGALWSTILYGKGYLYYLTKSLIKNIGMLPVEVIVLVLFFQMMLPVVSRLKLTPPQPTTRIPFF